MYRVGYDWGCRANDMGLTKHMMTVEFELLRYRTSSPKGSLTLLGALVWVTMPFGLIEHLPRFR